MVLSSRIKKKRSQDKLHFLSKSEIHFGERAMTSASISEGLQSLIQLDRDAQKPLYHQLLEQLSVILLKGRLLAGQRLPSTRTLAQVLGISRNVVIAAYPADRANQI